VVTNQAIMSQTITEESVTNHSRILTSEKEKDTSNFFRSQTHEDEYWEKYLQARPKYSPEFYSWLLQYHHNSQDNAAVTENIAHDIGTGPGNVAAVLSKHFDKVIASDLNENHLRVAERRLQGNSDKALISNIVLDHIGAEDVHSKYPAGSASFIAAAECMALLDAEKALSSWAAALRPGGTLAIWFYGRPHFVEADGYDANACQEIYDRIADAAFEKAIKNGGPAHQAGWKRATDCMMSFLDNVSITSKQWTNVERWKWNSDWPLSFYGQAACDFPIDVKSSVLPSENVKDVKDRSFWGEDWSISDWRLFLKMNLPVFIEGDDQDDTEEQWRMLEQKMGGEGVKRATGWPVVAILATRK
jgi:SAM-dependent methyltransferase